MLLSAMLLPHLPSLPPRRPIFSVAAVVRWLAGWLRGGSVGGCVLLVGGGWWWGVSSEVRSKTAHAIFSLGLVRKEVDHAHPDLSADRPPQVGLQPLGATWPPEGSVALHAAAGGSLQDRS